MADNKVAVKKDVGTQVIERVNILAEQGMTFPADYNYVNAIKASVIDLQEVKDRNGKAALEVCTPASVQSALFSMVTKGLDVSKKQAYFIVRGTKLCLDPSYFGNILQVKRLYPDWEPIAHTIREGDEFEYSINPENGKMKLVKHVQKLENLDKPFIGAYVYLPCGNGEMELYVMTKKQIYAAWSKSANKSLSTHKEFDEKMACKTIINSGCTKVINATPTTNGVAPADDDDEPTNQNNGGEEPYVDYEEVPEAAGEQPEDKAAPTEKKNDAAEAPAENAEEDPDKF